MDQSAQEASSLPVPLLELRRVRRLVTLSRVMTREYTPRRSVRKNQPTVEIRRLQCAAQLEEIARLHKISRTTVAHVKNLLSGVFRHAAQQGYFDAANPVKLAEIPAFAASGTETKPYSLEEIAAMLNVLPEPSATAVATAAFTGLRLGELRGLTWESYEPSEDVDSLGWLNVTRSIWRSSVGEPKTAKSKAPVPVIPQLALRLEDSGGSGGPEAGRL